MSARPWRGIHFIYRWSMIGWKAGFRPSKSRSGFARQPGAQKIANQRRLDIGSNHGATDRLQQNKGELAALDLLVLRHQRQQRVGIAESLLGKSRDVLQMGRQTHFGKVMLDARGI